MATADEIIVRLTAQTDQLKAGMAEGAAAVKSTQDEMAASMQTSMNAFRQFDNITKESVKSTEGLAAAQKALDAARASGAFTTEELAAKEALVTAAMQKVGAETQAASGALSMFTRNSRTMYSTSALITDAMTGQFSRMRREVAALGNETGLMARAFQLLVSPAGVAGLAVAGLGVAFVEAADRFSRFQQTILSTGDIIGMTAGQLQTMSDDVGRVTGASFDAVDAVNSIGRSGLFTGEQLRTAAESAVYFSQVTGENMDKAARVIEQLQEKPKEAIVKLNDQYHFLTQSQAELIVQLLQTGQNAQAAAVAVQAFHDAMADRAQEMNANTTALARDWHDVKQWTQGSLEALAEYLNMLGGSKDTTDQLNRAYIQLANDQSALFKIEHPFTNQADAINKDMQAIDALRNKQAQEEAQATKTAQANKQAAETLDSGVGGKKGGMSGLEEQFKEQEAKAHASYDQMKVDAADFWNAQANDAKNSAAVQAEAYQKYIAARHQLDEQGLRNESEADRKSTEAAKRAAEGHARAMKQAQAEIQDEIRKTGRAMDEAMRKQITDAQQAANASVQAATQTYQRVADALQERLRLGEITSQQEVGALRRAAQEEYEDKRKALQGELALVQQKPQEVARVNAQIEQLERKHDLLMQKLAEKAALDYQKTWQERLRPISNAFDQMINGMMQGTQTLGQAMRNMLQNIAAAFVQMGIQTLTNWLANEVAKRQSTKLTAVQQIASASAIAGAQGTASFAGAPWPVDMGAPAFGAAMALSAMAYQSMASAERGWERVPADGMMTQLHRDEMVLPKHVADPIRNMARSAGNGGGAPAVHIHAMDARSFGSFLKRNPAALRMALAHAGRNGW